MTDEEVKHNLTRKGHPKALYMLFMVEMWERFNYYGMRALLVLFMISSVLNFSKATSSKIYGMFTALVYLTPVLGGYLADRFIGKRHSITIGAILMAAGQFVLASYEIINPVLALATGLTLIIIGNGFFKPNISTIVGELYEPNDPRRDSGFTISIWALTWARSLRRLSAVSWGKRPPPPKPINGNTALWLPAPV